MDYVLTTDALTKAYGSFKALSGLTMHVPKGAIYGFIGKNGSGKTTLMRLVCGLQEPTQGSYHLYGAPRGSKEIRQMRRRMGAIVETPSIYLDMTADENLKQQCRILGLPTYEDIPPTLELVGLEGTGKKKAKHFSLGMKQRLGIAIALLSSPDFLVLDEPVNGLDPQGIVEMRELLLTLNRDQQITILISSHILAELSRLVTHYGFIDKGQMVKEISAKELEDTCQKRTRLRVSHIKTLARVLDTLGIAYKILADNKADVYGQVNVTQLTLALAKENCDILSITGQDESLESYYMALVGGADHA